MSKNSNVLELANMSAFVFKYFIYVYVYMYVCVFQCVYTTCVGVTLEARDGVRSPGAGGRGSCGLPDTGARNRPQVL